jgi:hypothetical protein
VYPLENFPRFLLPAVQVPSVLVVQKSGQVWAVGGNGAWDVAVRIWSPKRVNIPIKTKTAITVRVNLYESMDGNMDGDMYGDMYGVGGDVKF